MDALHNLLNAEALLQSFGPWALAGIAIVIFIESGVLFPFLPGDSLLVTAAILASSLGITHWELWMVAAIAAVAGDQVGYHLGHSFGPRFFKPDARVLRTDRLEEATAFFEKYGALALVLGRFVPIVRTYVPLAAGTARMPFKHFVVWNTLGALTWVTSMVLVSTLLGGIPGIAKNIELLAIVIVAISVLPVVISVLRKRAVAKRAVQEAASID
ncbi:VTT domain-containing protein [Actinomycetaceae bacterium L2_0104]